MIRILNRGKPGDATADDERVYDVSVTNGETGHLEFVTSFRHRRSHGLPTCLELAARAVKKKVSDDMPETKLLREAGCKCELPLHGYRPGRGHRCRLCNAEVVDEAEIQATEELDRAHKAQEMGAGNGYEESCKKENTEEEKEEADID
jgi:hypothetical protein